MAKEELDKSLLEGLKWSGSKSEEIEENGIKKQKAIPFTRALKTTDVLDWKDKGSSVVIVATDGKKHTVKKDAAPAKEAGPKK